MKEFYFITINYFVIYI